MKQKHVSKKRVCLYCEKEFDSQWNGNRICKKCLYKLNRIDEIDYEEMIKDEKNN